MCTSSRWGQQRATGGRRSKLWSSESLVQGHGFQQLTSQGHPRSLTSKHKGMQADTSFLNSEDASPRSIGYIDHAVHTIKLNFVGEREEDAVFIFTQYLNSMEGNGDFCLYVSPHHNSSPRSRKASKFPVAPTKVHIIIFRNVMG